MKLQRFFIGPENVIGTQVTVSDRDVLNQIRKVLRLRVGDRVIFLDGTGKEYIASIREMDNSSLKAGIDEILENKNEPDLKITLCQALCKKDKFEWVLQKGTEVGISGFIPVLADRSEKLGLNLERAEKILKESSEQSERGIIPRLQEIQKFEDLIKNIPGEKIILDKSGEPIKNYQLSITNYQLHIFVGPEGGWTENELKSAKENGAKIVSLGNTVLRTETAGLVATAILLNK